MTLPATLRICGRQFTVKLADLREDDTQSLGCVRHHRQQIGIERTAHEEQQATTLLHEALEVICNANEIDVTHAELCVLETALYALLKDNPRWW